MRKLILTLILAVIVTAGFAQTKAPDTSKTPKVYWSDFARLQQLTQELTRRIHKLDIPALKRDSADMYLNEIGYLLPLVYKRTYPEADGGKKK